MIQIESEVLTDSEFLILISLKKGFILTTCATSRFCFCLFSRISESHVSLKFSVLFTKLLAFTVYRRHSALTMTPRGMNPFVRAFVLFVRSLRPSVARTPRSDLVGTDHLGNKYFETPPSKRFLFNDNHKLLTFSK